MNPPLVSVVVPTYNCAGILRGCLDSIVSQSYTNIEVLVMDGGSKDGTVAVAESYGERVQVFSEPDRGIYDAMNKGIAVASGDWLYFIGADDTFCDSDVVSDMMASEGAYDDGTLMLYGDVYAEILGGRYRGETTLDQTVEFNICHQAIFYRSLLFKNEPTYDLRYRLYADWDLNMRIYLRYPGAQCYVDRLVANYTGGVSNAKDDIEFLSNKLNLVWFYALEAQGEKRARSIMLPLYLYEIKEARRTGDSKLTKRYLAEMLRRTSITTELIPSLLRSVRRRCHLPTLRKGNS